MTDTMPSDDQPTDAQPTDAQPTDAEQPKPEMDVPTNPLEAPTHQGDAGEIEKIAHDYVIPLSDGAIEQWAKAGPEEFKKYAEKVAEGMYPTFAPQIAAGVPTRILLDPYVEVAKQVLGPAGAVPNWSDPKWSAALQGGIDPKTGRHIPMTLDEWRKHLMTHPGHGWEYTPQAHEKAAQFRQILEQGFGQRRA